ncbi:phage head closure protein [Brucella sp. BE17]|uniref:phage head closure protein n=1 Tax=Brucella sp. BE17 TaxID=3142977 RepID=UPI0031BA928D
MNNVLFIDPGQLDRELALEELRPEADGLGGYVETWAEIAMLWGRIEPVSVTQRNFATRPQPEATHRILLRFRDGLTTAMRFRKGGRLFRLETILDPDETGRYLICTAVEEGR